MRDRCEERNYWNDARTMAGMPSWLRYDERQNALYMETPDCDQECCTPPYRIQQTFGGVTIGLWPYERPCRPEDTRERPELGEYGYWQYNDKDYYIEGPEGSLAPLGVANRGSGVFAIRELVDYLNGDWKPAEHPTEIMLFAKLEVCPLCEGKGRHVNPGVDASGLTAEDFDQDPGFREDYFSGMYDQECNECGGRRVVPVPDPEENDPELLKLYEDRMRDDWEYRREQAAERAMGA